MTIGHIVGCAKDSSLDKLFNMLNTWYMEREGIYTNVTFVEVQTVQVNQKLKCVFFFFRRLDTSSDRTDSAVDKQPQSRHFKEVCEHRDAANFLRHARREDCRREREDGRIVDGAVVRDYTGYGSRYSAKLDCDHEYSEHCVGISFVDNEGTGGKRCVYGCN